MIDAKVSAVTSKEAYLTTVTTRNHTILVDEPTEKGGKDLAPKPDELLAAALASCTAITLKMYLDRKNWEVGDITVDVEIDRDEKLTESIFTRTIKFSNANLEADQQKRINFIANACPVHKMLMNQIKIETHLQ